MAVAKKLSNDNNNVIAVIGDGAMSAGMAYEAMNNAGVLKSRLIVILNDNEMSIAKPVGAMSKYLVKLMSGKFYFSFRETVKMVISAFSKRFAEKTARAENLIKGLVSGGTLFSELGFYYILLHRSYHQKQFPIYQEYPLSTYLLLSHCQIISFCLDNLALIRVQFQL